MSKNLEISLLLDYYSGMLTEKQREVVQWYHNEDLSLSEIAEHTGITRQGVRDCIKRAEAQLIECEERLGFKQRFDRIQHSLEDITSEAISLQGEGERVVGSHTLCQRAQRILDLVGEITW